MYVYVCMYIYIYMPCLSKFPCVDHRENFEFILISSSWIACWTSAMLLYVHSTFSIFKKRLVSIKISISILIIRTSYWGAFWDFCNFLIIAHTYTKAQEKLYKILSNCLVRNLTNLERLRWVKCDCYNPGHKSWNFFQNPFPPNSMLISFNNNTFYTFSTLILRRRGELACLSHNILSRIVVFYE